MRSTGFISDVQSTLMDMPVDGSCLCGEKADSALEGRATVRSLVLSALHVCRTNSVTRSLAMVGASNISKCSLPSKPLSLFVAEAAVPTGPVDSEGSVQPNLLLSPAAASVRPL